VTPELLIDHSAFSRLEHAKLPADRVADVLDLMRKRRVMVCLPFLLEAGYSARNMRDHVARLDGLRALPHAAIDATTEARALEAQRQLAATGHHRLSPPDLIIAALAEGNDAGVLHYDRDYDLIAERTDLSFESVWLAPAGSL
jgi:predicted nucleic acid-binding protein